MESFSLSIVFEHLFFSIFAQFTSHSFRNLLFLAISVLCAYSLLPIPFQYFLFALSFFDYRFNPEIPLALLFENFSNFCRIIYFEIICLVCIVHDTIWNLRYFRSGLLFFTSFILHFCCLLLLSNLVLLFSTSAYVLYLLLVFSLFSAMVSRTFFMIADNVL